MRVPLIQVRRDLDLIGQIGGIDEAAVGDLDAVIAAIRVTRNGNHGQAVAVRDVRVKIQGPFEKIRNPVVLEIPVSAVGTVVRLGIETMESLPPIRQSVPIEIAVRVDYGELERFLRRLHSIADGDRDGGCSADVRRRGNTERALAARASEREVCIRDERGVGRRSGEAQGVQREKIFVDREREWTAGSVLGDRLVADRSDLCLLYTSDAADDS